MVSADVIIGSGRTVFGLAAGSSPPEDLSALLSRPAWQTDALCREYRDVAFVPARGQPSGPAKAVCDRCLCRAECLAYALDDPLAGVLCGTTGPERAALRKAPAAA